MEVLVQVVWVWAWDSCHLGSVLLHILLVEVEEEVQAVVLQSEVVRLTVVLETVGVAGEEEEEEWAEIVASLDRPSRLHRDHTRVSSTVILLSFHLSFLYLYQDNVTTLNI